MCTVVVLRRPGHAWPLIVAANRDEMTERPGEPPARHWPDRPRVTGGLDRLAGGTWLGLNTHGVVAGVLNRRGSLGPEPGRRSRGELPLEALGHAEAGEAARALAHIETASYRSFNLVIADAADAFWLASRSGGNGADRVAVAGLPAGLSMITAGEVNAPTSPRIALYLPRFQAAQPPDPGNAEWSEWQSLLASRIHDSEAGPEGAMNVVLGDGFATVSSSLIALPAPQTADTRPVWLFAAGPPGEAAWEPVQL